MFGEMKESLFLTKKIFIIISKDIQKHMPSLAGTEKLTNLPCLLYLMCNQRLIIIRCLIRLSLSHKWAEKKPADLSIGELIRLHLRS